MESDVALMLGSEMLITAAKIASPILLASLAVGLLISVLQVATQIQEMTLTFVPKIIVAVMVVLSLGGWMLSTLVEYTKQTFIHAAGM